MSTPSKLMLIYKIALLALIIGASFGAGYLIRGEVQRAPIIIEKHSS